MLIAGTFALQWFFRAGGFLFLGGKDMHFSPSDLG